jgi:small-conductance mechanosensitive channel
MINRSLGKFLATTPIPPTVQLFIRRSLIYGFAFGVFIYITAELKLGTIFYPVVGASVLVGAALALAVKDILGDAVAGLFILADKDFNIGDDVATLGYRGEITDVTLRKTRLKTPEGTIIVLPNGKIDSSGWILHHRKTKMEN